MSIRPTVILCVLAILGVAAAVLVDRFDGGLERGASDDTRRLLGDRKVPIDALQRIVLEREGETTMVFALDSPRGRWDQVEPILHPMDMHSMRKFALLADGLLVIDTLAPTGGAVSRAALGLDPPRATLRLEAPGESITLRFGRRGLGGLAYLEVDGDDAIHVVGQELHERATDMDAREWRDRTIFRDVGVDADRVEIVNGEKATILARDRKRWRMEAPVVSRLDDIARDELFQALGRARVGGFVLDAPKDLSSFGLNRPVASLTITSTRLGEDAEGITRTPETQRLLVGTRIGVGAQARFGLVDGRDVVVRLDEPVLRALFPQSDELVATTASAAQVADIWSIRIAATLGADIELRRTIDGRWIAPDAGDVEVPSERVASMLATLTGARATGIQIRPFPREAEVATISMFRQDGRPLDTVQVARTPDGRWILENGDGVLRLFPSSTAIYVSREDFGL